MKKSLVVIYILIITNFIIGQEVNLNNIKIENQFNFWIGSWNLEWINAEGKTEKGTNKISKILNDKIIEENFEGGSFSGRSWTAFDKLSGKWKQTWVDNNGSYLDFIGGIEGSEMILYHYKSRSDETDKMRMVFYDIEENKFSWNWEKLDAGTNQWKVLWLITYSRN